MWSNYVYYIFAYISSERERERGIVDVEEARNVMHPPLQFTVCLCCSSHRTCRSAWDDRSWSTKTCVPREGFWVKTLQPKEKTSKINDRNLRISPVHRFWAIAIWWIFFLWPPNGKRQTLWLCTRWTLCRLWNWKDMAGSLEESKYFALHHHVQPSHRNGAQQGSFIRWTKQGTPQVAKQSKASEATTERVETCTSS